MHHVHRIDALAPGAPGRHLYFCHLCGAVLSGEELTADPGHTYVELPADPCTIAGKRVSHVQVPSPAGVA